MNRPAHVIPAILLGDAIGSVPCILLFLSSEPNPLHWLAWLLFVLFFNLIVYWILQEKPLIRPGQMRQSWLITLGRRVQRHERTLVVLLLLEALFGWASHAAGLDAFSWILCMAIVNLMVFYWHHARRSQSSVKHPQTAQEQFEETAIRLARLRERRRYSP